MTDSDSAKVRVTQNEGKLNAVAAWTDLGVFQRLLSP
jgi:hypothetical protein